MSVLDEIYNPRILELAANIPRGTRLEHPQASATAHSKLCGSTVSVDLNMEPARESAEMPVAAPQDSNGVGDSNGTNGDLMRDVDKSLAARKPTPGASDVRNVGFSFPSGAPQAGVVQLDRRFPSKVLVGEPFEYELKVTKLLDRPIDGVE